MRTQHKPKTTHRRTKWPTTPFQSSYEAASGNCPLGTEDADKFLKGGAPWSSQYCGTSPFRAATPSRVVQASDTADPRGHAYPAGPVLCRSVRAGPKGAICIALAWNYSALLRRLWRRERLPGVLLIATLGLTARSALALVSKGSLFVYFLQPSLATALLGGAFLLSIPLGRPLAEKLAHDFVPMPPSFFKRPKVRQLFVKISLLWALVSLANAAGTVALLVNFPIGTYLAAKTGFSAVLTIGAIALSSWWFRRSLRRHSAEQQQLALAAD